MKKLIWSLFKQFIFWILFFAFARTIYLVYNFEELISDKIPFFDILSGYWYGLKLDVATACYFLVFPLLIVLVQSLYNPKWLYKVNRIYTLIAIVIFSLIIATELGIYSEWHTKCTSPIRQRYMDLLIA